MPRLQRIATPVTNGGFGKSPISHGFDWHLKTVDGVSSFLNANPNALGFEFSGEEPDSFPLMDQTVPVQEGKDYALAVDYGTSGIAPGSGIEWSVTDARSGAVLAKTAEPFGGARRRSLRLLHRPGWSRIRESVAALPAAAGHGAGGGKACPERSAALRCSAEIARGRKSPLPGLILRRSETTLKKQRTEGDRSSTRQTDRG